MRHEFKHGLNQHLTGLGRSPLREPKTYFTFDQGRLSDADNDGWKEYSGLTDDAFKVEDLDTSVLRVEAPFYEELHVSFLGRDPGTASMSAVRMQRLG